jgi:hypothetical protein
MKTYKVTYDTIEAYDPEYSCWKRTVVSAESYDDGISNFIAQYPGNKIFSIDEVDENGKYI